LANVIEHGRIPFPLALRQFLKDLSSGAPDPFRIRMMRVQVPIKCLKKFFFGGE
jgi:hypothetical protein